MREGKAAWWNTIGRGLAVVALAAGLSGCVGFGGGGTTSSPGSAPPNAAQHAAIVESYGGVYRDPDLERTLSRMVAQLVAASEDPNRPYAITILNASAVNAFALPNGDLYVTRGLLTLANDASEVAAVFAHEMAHVTRDHAGQRQDQVLTAQIVSTAVQGVVQDQSAVNAASSAGQQTLASFSRQQEIEADLVGIQTIAQAGYDPYAASRFLSAMSRYEQYRQMVGIRQDQRPAFLASHPSNQDRINAAATAASQIAPAGGGITDRTRYLAALDGVVFGDDSQQGYIRGTSFYHADRSFGFAVADGFSLDNTQQAVLASGPDGTAMRFDSVTLIPPNQPLTDYLRSGWINGLDPASVTAVTINGLPAAKASAAVGGWYFRITVIRHGADTYRFIFASNRLTSGFTQVAESIAGSFRSLSPGEAGSLRPLRVSVLEIVPGDTLASVAAQMRGVSNPAELFLVLNGIEPGTFPAPGSLVKIVSD